MLNADKYLLPFLVLHFCYNHTCMLHVKIDNQASVFIHVLEQVQRFKQEQAILISSPPESEIVRGGEVVPMRRTIATPLVNPEVPRIKRKCQEFTFGSDGEVWCAVCPYVGSTSLCYFSRLSVFRVDAHAKFWIGLRAAEYIQGYVKLCRHALTHEHAWASQRHALWHSCLLSWLALGKGLSGRSEVTTVGFHG